MPGKEPAVEQGDYVGAFRRRWWVVVAAIAMGALGAWLTRSTEPPLPTGYQAGAAILGSSDTGTTNLFTISALAKLGEVPRRVAKALDYQGDPTDLANQITTDPQQDSGILWIVATAEDPTRAEELANTFARQLVRWHAAGRTRSSLDEAQRLDELLDRLARDTRELDTQIASGVAPDVALLTAERDANVRLYGFLVERYQQVSAAALEPSPLSIVQRARAGPVQVDPGFLTSITPATRTIVGGALGLLAGLALVLILERLDRRIRTRAVAERSFRLPVLVEIPPVPRRGRRTIVEDNGRVSPGVEPFHLLGAILAQSMAPSPGPPGDGHASRPSRTILVTSPGSAQGKSRVVGSLAAAYAETGKKVLVLSCDFRHPVVHRFFKVPNDQGLSDALSSGNGRGLLESVAKSTGLSNLKVVPSGSSIANPSALLSSERMGRALEEARQAADVVLLDTPAMLTDGDAAYLVDDVDSVLVVARTGKTTLDEAERTAEILERLEAPVAGVALTSGGSEGSRWGFPHLSRHSLSS
jgi:capsular exopolysaccharide synthesis family protein